MTRLKKSLQNIIFVKKALSFAWWKPLSKKTLTKKMISYSKSYALKQTCMDVKMDETS